MSFDIFWNHLDYTDQVKAINLIKELANSQPESIIKTALIAAVNELEIWSNSPDNLVKENSPKKVIN